MTSITAEIGTSDNFETIELSADPAVSIAEAVDLEHHCTEDPSCDIARALEDGYPYWAASLLQGATEVPLLDAVIAHYCANGLDFGAHAEADRLAWLTSDTWTEHAHECAECGAYTFDGDYWTAEQCGNCLAPLPTTEANEDD